MNNKFLVTKKYLQFTEVCELCKEYGYIGLCYGTPGVGKTLSARYYTQWDTIENILPPEHLVNPLPLDNIEKSNSAFYTIPANPTASQIKRELTDVINNLNWLIGDIVAKKGTRTGLWDKQTNYTKLVVIDEADRLKPASLEQVRDIYDRTKIAILLIGMPGIEKKFSRYPQLYSRVGYVHNFKPIGKDEIHTIINEKINEFGIKITRNNDTEESIAEIIRLTRGNFRLIQRLFEQIDRIMKLNNISELRKDIVDIAKENLIIGPIR